MCIAICCLLSFTLCNLLLLRIVLDNKHIVMFNKFIIIYELNDHDIICTICIKLSLLSKLDKICQDLDIFYLICRVRGPVFIVSFNYFILSLFQCTKRFLENLQNILSNLESL